MIFRVTPGGSVFLICSIFFLTASIHIGDYDVTELADGVYSPERADAHLGITSNDPAARDLYVLALNRALELADRDEVRVELLGVGIDPYLAVARTGHADFADAVHGLQHPLDLFVGDFGGFSKTLIAGHDQ